MNETKFHVGQQLKNTPFDREPTFEVIKITCTLDDPTPKYKVKHIRTGKVQTTTEDFLYL